MEFLQKIMILIAGCNIILAKPSYDYGHESYKSFHVPWAIKYPQPLISIDGAWPISYSYPLSREYDYPYEENNYQQELLTNSLNKALTKLNQLLPHSNLQETTSYPPYTKPEVLAEALNKAIDRLGVLLTRQPLPLSTKTEATTALPMSTKTEATTAQPIKNRQAIMPPEKVSDSVSSAISELNKLFATLPDELKANSTQTPPTSGNTGNIANKPIVLEFQPMRPAPFISQPMFYPELKPNMVVNTKDSSTESTLFTSNHLVEQNKVTEKIDESNNAVVPTTAVPNIASNIGITSENTDNNIFTTFVPAVETSPPTSETVWPAENVETTTDIVVETTVLPTEKNVESTDPSIKDSETDITTIRNEVSSTTPLTIPDIDIRFKEDEARSDFIFPDQFEQMLIQNNKPIVQQEVDLASRFQEQSSTQITLEYKPSRPPFYPDIFPPNPSPRPETDSNPQSSTVFDLADRNKVTTVVQQQQPAQTQRPVQNNQNPQIILEYKPSRPPFHPDVYPPQPSQSPETVSNLQTSTNFELSDRNKPTTVINEQRPTQTQRPIDNNQNTPIVLEYKPSRPSFAPNPIFYPGQILTTSSTEKDGSQTTEASPDLDNRNKIPVTTSTTTEIIFTTTQNNQPFHPTHYYSTPISLEYKPTRPFYAPNPIFYPRPIIPPGTPWPASSTERSRN